MKEDSISILASGERNSFRPRENASRLFTQGAAAILAASRAAVWPLVARELRGMARQGQVFWIRVVGGDSRLPPSCCLGSYLYGGRGHPVRDWNFLRDELQMSERILLTIAIQSLAGLSALWLLYRKLEQRNFTFQKGES